MPINYRVDDPFHQCRHGDTYEYEGKDKCINCGAVYDDTLLEWVTPEEGWE